MRANATALISRQALLDNIAVIRRFAGNVPLCPAVKANAYGHGVEIVLPVLREAGVNQVAVANLHEALELRGLGWSDEILCLGAPLAWASEPQQREAAEQAVAAGVRCTVSNLEEARSLASAAAAQHRTAQVEIKIDSGMGRMGLLSTAAAGFIGELAALGPAVRVSGVYTHLACADEADDAGLTAEQLAAFGRLRAQLAARGLAVSSFHAANSAGIFRHPEALAGMSLCRPGICLYGYWDGPPTAGADELRPAMTVVSRIAAVRELPPGHCVGYGRTQVTSQPTRTGVVPIGYADGYRRELSNQAVMTIAPRRGQPGCRVPVLGRVSMDQTIVNVTGVADVRVGDEVVVIEADPSAPNSVIGLARMLRTISYEVTCLIGSRVAREKTA